MTPLDCIECIEPAELQAVTMERDMLREALRPFAGAEWKVWKGTDYADACRAAAIALGQEDGPDA